MPAARRKYYCTVELALDRLKGKWKPAIIYHLKAGGVRFGELKRRIPGISTKMLTLHLRQLEADDIVRRAETKPQSPREVTYDLSPRAKEIRTVLEQLHRWGSRYARTYGIETTVTSGDGRARARDGDRPRDG
jgi:DNA-binding HxlR family transcriptional regulator